MRSLYVFALVILVLPVYGQKEFKKADKLFSLKAYELAIKNYEGALSKYPENARGYAQLAEAYRMTNQLLPALKSYEKAFKLDDKLDGEYILQYAHTLKKVGMYEKAESWYRKYGEMDDEEASHFMASTDFAKKSLQEKDRYDIQFFEGNSVESDFAPFFYKDQIVYSSFRQDIKRTVDKKNESHINQPGNQLYITPFRGASETGSIRFLRPDGKEIYGIGPISYTDDGTKAAYMKNSFTSGCNQILTDESNMSIYLASADDKGDFMDPRPFRFNQVEYAYGFPHLCFNGTALYFASNRPGGLGGFDLYVSYLKDDEWTVPENLGPNVNSKGNEVSPYFDGENLYFASDYRQGLGGFDNFISKIVDGQWAGAENMGKGVNSPSDDYYLVPNMVDGSYYFTSNRLGGRGKDDIYIAYPLEVFDPEEMSEDIPLAVNLESLSDRRPGYSDEEELVRMNQDELNQKDQPSVVSVSDPTVVKRVENEADLATAVTIDDIYFDFEGAEFVSITKPFTVRESPELYFVQLASLSNSQGQLGYYSEVIQYGNLYRFFKPNSVKIRLGYFATKKEAEDVLKKVKVAGFRDAFVIADVLGVSEYELMNSIELGGGGRELFINEYSSTSQYKVKIDSYLNPLAFNIEAAEGIGQIEQWSKGRWTIFVLGGFPSYESAEKARIRAVNRGFIDAELVLDDGGILKRVSSR